MTKAQPIRSRTAARLTFGAAAFALVVATGGAAVAAEPWDRTPAFFDKTAPVAQSSGRGGAVSDLTAQARRQGRIKVIVGLDVAMSDDEITPMAAAREKASLKSVQDAVIANVFNRRTRTASGPASGEEPDVRRYETIPYLAMTVTPSELERLIADGRVTTIQEDVPVPPTLAQSVPLIQGDITRTAGFTGRGVAVAVLDTGVDIKHPTFGTRIKSEACFSSTVSGQSKSVCPKGVQESTKTGSGKNCKTNIFGCDHGTHVASIVASGGSGIRGVAPKANLIAIQVFSRFDNQGDCGSAPAPCVLSFNSDQLAGLERVFKLRSKYTIASINMSLGGGQFFAHCDNNNPAFTKMVKKLRKNGIATVIAAGNNGFNGSISSPACVSAAVAVGSTTKQDVVSGFSNHSLLVDVMAPGSDITAAVPGGSGVKSGTSMATPHIAGAFAVLKQSVPAATAKEIEQVIKLTGLVVARNGVAKPRVLLNDALLELQAEFQAEQQVAAD
ncbi:S8 family serine peptidase [Pseudoxanthobacter sp. M-2]|uniref:S8 family peptidase n=1 Tax=Pseudoxanthobacter sp. M-2 TaxID=3078754 RepID=UPI0038FD0E87